MSRFLDAVTFGPARRRRQMEKMLAELDRQDEIARLRGHDPLETWRPSGQVIPLDERRQRRRQRQPRGGRGRDDRRVPGYDREPAEHSRRTTLIIGAVVAALVVVSILNRNGSLFGKTSHGPTPVATRPTPGTGESAQPLGTPPTPPAGQGGYAFERFQPGSTTRPVSWDPCRAIHYVVAGAPPAADAQVVTQAVQSMSQASGFQFVADGPTVERVPPKPQTRAPFQPGLYGDKWAPLIIDWTEPTSVPALGGPVIGIGGSEMVKLGDQITSVSGEVALDTPQLAKLDPAHVRAVVLHELGHALGLAHVQDPSQIMYPETQLKVTELGPGDRRGLAILGKGSCAPNL